MHLSAMTKHEKVWLGVVSLVLFRRFVSFHHFHYLKTSKQLNAALPMWCAWHKPCLLLRDETVPVMLTGQCAVSHVPCSQTNNYDLWSGNETTYAHEYKI